MNTFEALQAFFAETEPSEAEFLRLFADLKDAHAERPDEVVAVWLPFALQALEQWPDATRLWPNGVWWDESGRDLFPERSHPLHRLGRYLNVEEVRADELVAYGCAPDVAELVSFTVFGVHGLTADDLRQTLEGLSRAARLQELTLEFAGLDETHARVLSEATHLRALVSLQIAGHEIPFDALKKMLEAQHFRGLRHLSLGDVPPDTMPDVNQQRELMAILPSLETTLAPHIEIPWHARPSEPWSEGERSSTRARLERVLDLYRSDDEQTYPFLGPHFLCHNGFVELSDDDFERPDLDLQDVWPGLGELQTLPDQAVRTVYVLAVRQGALATAFDDNGELIAPVQLRPMGRYWTDPPRGEPSESYHGACFLQTQLALEGLHAEQVDELLHLSPLHSRDSALTRFGRAWRVSQVATGGWLSDYCCTPWHEPLAGLSDWSVQMRATVVWEECDHQFDHRGELADRTQTITVLGDVVPLLRALSAEGFDVSAGRDIQFLLHDRASSDLPTSRAGLH